MTTDLTYDQSEFDTLIKDIKGDLLNIAEGGPFKTIDIDDFSDHELGIFGEEHPEAIFKYKGYGSEKPIQAVIKDEFKNDSRLRTTFYIAVDRVERRYGGPAARKRVGGITMSVKLSCGTPSESTIPLEAVKLT